MSSTNNVFGYFIFPLIHHSCFTLQCLCFVRHWLKESVRWFTSSSRFKMTTGVQLMSGLLIKEFSWLFDKKKTKQNVTPLWLKWKQAMTYVYWRVALVKPRPFKIRISSLITTSLFFSYRIKPKASGCMAFLRLNWVRASALPRSPWWTVN